MLALPIPSERLLLGLEQHRQLTTRQCRAIYAPDVSIQTVRRHLRELLRRGLVCYSDVGSPHHRAWYLSRLGAKLTRSERAVLSDDEGAGPLRRHTWAVNEIGLAFLRSARELGHGFEPEDWRHEVWHPLAEKSRRKLKTDAVLEYRMGRKLWTSFVEYDSGSKRPASRLVEQLADYGRFRQGGPWERYYRAFPSVLVVMDSALSRQALEGRLRQVLFQASQHPELRKAPLTLRFALLEDLQLRGPFAPICWRPGRSEPVNWRGETETELKIGA